MDANRYPLSLVLFYIFVTEEKEIATVRYMLNCVGIPESSVPVLKVFAHRSYFVHRTRPVLKISVNFVRLFLSEELPSSISKVLWLDSDIIVQRDIKELWDSYLTKESEFTVAGASRTIPVGRLPGDRTGEEYPAMYQDRYGKPFKGTGADFNAGVMLINLEHMRKDDGYLLKEMIWWMERNEEKMLWWRGSQPLANLLALISPAGTYEILAPTWNVYLQGAKADPNRGWHSESGILHWASEHTVKPWEHNLSDPEIELWLPHGLSVMKCVRAVQPPRVYL